MLHTLRFSLQNAVYFIMLPFLVLVLFKFYIHTFYKLQWQKVKVIWKDFFSLFHKRCLKLCRENKVICPWNGWLPDLSSLRFCCCFFNYFYLPINLVPKILKHSVYEHNPLVPLPFFLCSFHSCFVLTVYVDFVDI